MVLLILLAVVVPRSYGFHLIGMALALNRQCDSSRVFQCLPGRHSGVPEDRLLAAVGADAIGSTFRRRSTRVAWRSCSIQIRPQ